MAREPVTVWVDQKQYQAVGATLARARERSGLTQQQLAKLLRKPQSFVSNFERRMGKRARPAHQNLSSRLGGARQEGWSDPESAHARRRSSTTSRRLPRRAWYRGHDIASSTGRHRDRRILNVRTKPIAATAG